MRKKVKEERRRKWMRERGREKEGCIKREIWRWERMNEDDGG